ncbi:hypothetical protein J3R83DRAFT_12748 [Lanmaoa asiatica]|nr:hypothetical protein J3R83DRAFT_12748 [Lanmaoa asiatica]
MPEPLIPVEPPLIGPDSDLREHEMADDDTHSSDRSSSHKDNPVWMKTDSDPFDLSRHYQNSFPTYDPENMAYFGQFNDAPTFDQSNTSLHDQPPWYSWQFSSLLRTANHQYFAPFLNVTTYRLMSWFYNSSSTKSLGDLDQLVDNVLGP